MSTIKYEKLSVSEAFALNLSEEERSLLLGASQEGLSTDDLHDELRSAAFDNYWDGETPEEEFKDDCWQNAYKDYVSFLATAKEYPLHFSVLAGHEQNIFKHCSQGASASAEDRDGLTPIDMATLDDRALVGVDILKGLVRRKALSQIAQQVRSEPDLAPIDEVEARMARSRIM